MYFDRTGPENTGKTLEIAVRAARQRGVRAMVVASCSGETARALLGAADGIRVICVTHVQGFAERGKNEMEPAVRAALTEAGVSVLTTTHVLSGAERGLSKRFGGTYPVEIMAQTLRMLGQGVKVCVEIAVMALDAGLVPHGQPIIAIGGTNEGADTAVLLVPSHASSILETRVCEILCKPSLLDTHPVI